MRKCAKLTTAIFLAASVNVSYGGENCLPPDAGMDNPMKVFQCFQRVLDTQQQQIGELTAENQNQQKQIAALKKENQSLRQKTDVINVSGETKIGPNLTLNGETRDLFGIHLIGTDNNGVQRKWSLYHMNDYNKQHSFDIYQYVDTDGNGIHCNGGGVCAPRFMINENGNVGIGTITPTEKLQVSGNIKANAFNTGDIFFEKDGKTLWQMFEDEQGLYVKHIKTGNVYRLMLEKIQ